MYATNYAINHAGDLSFSSINYHITLLLANRSTRESVIITGKRSHLLRVGYYVSGLAVTWDWETWYRSVVSQVRIQYSPLSHGCHSLTALYLQV